MVSTLLSDLRTALDRLPGIQAITLFGSRARGAEDPDSDLDLQVITSRTDLFADDRWLRSMPHPVVAYALRPAFGGVTKVTIVFSGAGEADLVVLPSRRLRLARALVVLGVHRWSGLLRRGLGDLAIVLRPGFRMMKGGESWEAFFRRVIAEVDDPTLDDETIWRRGACAYADFCSLQHKVRRGELVAAQRWLHVHLVETNLALLHELRRRAGQRSFHDGRRVEQLLTVEELAPVAISAALDAAALSAAAVRAIGCTRTLVLALTGREPIWPRPS